MRQSLGLALAAGIILVVAACGGTTPAPTAGPGGGTPAAVITPAPVATARPGGGTATGTECAAIPTFSIANPNPTFPQDTELLARFPASIGGAPATAVSAVPFGALLCFGGQEGYNQAVAGLPAGYNWATVGFGSAKYELDGESVTLSAFRTPGSDARTLVDALIQLAATSGEPMDGTMSQGSIGGKNALIFTEGDGTVTYGYVAGDTLYFLEEGVTEAQAATIFAALP